MSRTASSCIGALLFLLPFACLAGTSMQGDASSLIQKYGCLSCHGMVRAQVGPGFAQIAARYRNDAAAADRLAATISNGGVGNWGRVIMPRQHGMTDAEAHVLADWVLSRPSPP